MGAFPWNAVIEGAAGLASTLSGAFINSNQQEKQSELNYQYWLKQQEYNSPSNQMARLRAAGINPFMADVSSGNATSSAQSANYTPFDGTQFTQALQNGLAQDMQRQVNDAQVRKLNADASLSEIESQFQQQVFLQKVEKFLADVRSSKADASQKEDASKLFHDTMDTAKLQAEANLENTRRDLLIKDGQIELQKTQNLIQKFNLEKFLPTQYDNLIADLAIKAAQEKWTYKQIEIESEKLVLGWYNAKSARSQVQISSRMADIAQQQADTARDVGASTAAKNYADSERFNIEKGELVQSVKNNIEYLKKEYDAQDVFGSTNAYIRNFPLINQVSDVLGGLFKSRFK